MKNLAIAAWLVLGATVFAGCSDDEGAVQADVRYSVRCSGCGTMVPTVDILAIDMQDGHRVTCSATAAGESRLLTFQAYNADGFGIELVNALFTPGSAGSVLGEGCEVVLAHDGKPYRGSCRSTDPAPQQPCQVTELSVDGGAVTGKIFCDEMNLDGFAGPAIDVTSVGDPAEPFTFTFTNCRGL